MRHETLITMLNWISGTTIISQLSYPFRLSSVQLFVTDLRAGLVRATTGAQVCKSTLTNNRFI